MKKYKVYCEICGYKSSNIEKLTPIKQTNVPSGIPKYDQERKVLVHFTPLERPKKFKCPKCGRGVIAKVIEEKKQNEQDRTIGNKTSSEGREVSRETTKGNDSEDKEVSI